MMGDKWPSISTEHLQSITKQWTTVATNHNQLQNDLQPITINYKMINNQ
jgi:hypothetical protein